MEGNILFVDDESLERTWAEARTWHTERRKRSAEWQNLFPSRVAAPPPKGRWLYRMYDAADNLLYVGITDRGHIREREHRRNKAWYFEVHHITYERHTTRTALESEERCVIQREHPRYNIQHNAAPDE